jgi:glycogen operon protein
MITAGDERGRTQAGNNNAYCQDNETSWLDWSELSADDASFLEFVKDLVWLRLYRGELRRERFFTAEDVTWLHPAGRAMTEADWNDPSLRTLACCWGKNSRYTLLMNSGSQRVLFSWPYEVGHPGVTLVTTAGPSDEWEPAEDPSILDDVLSGTYFVIPLKARSLKLMRDADT